MSGGREGGERREDNGSASHSNCGFIGKVMLVTEEVGEGLICGLPVFGNWSSRGSIGDVHYLDGAFSDYITSAPVPLKPTIPQL